MTYTDSEKQLIKRQTFQIYCNFIGVYASMAGVENITDEILKNIVSFSVAAAKNFNEISQDDHFWEIYEQGLSALS
jgi:hypothetical protein